MSMTSKQTELPGEFKMTKQQQPLAMKTSRRQPRVKTIGRPIPPERRTLAALAATVLMSMVATSPPAMASTSPDPKVVSELRGKTQALLDAIAPGDVKVWDRLLEADAIQVDENDVVRRKKEILADLKPLGPALTGRLAIDDFRVVQHGDLAV